MKTEQMMKIKIRKTIWLIVLVVIIWGAKDISAQKKIDLEKEKTELLKTHQIDKKAHFETDVKLLLEGQLEDFIAVSNGKIERPTLADRKQMFTTYFKDAKYYEWDELEPPIISVSKDATMGWIITRIKVRRTQKQSSGAEREVSFVYAGIMTYEKQKGKWVKIANVSTFQ